MTSQKSISLKKQSVFLFVGRFTAFIINFFIPIILVRLFSTADYGLFQQYNLLITTIVPISSMWLNSSLFYFFPISSSHQKSNYLLVVFLMEIILWSILAIVFFFWSSTIFKFLNLYYFFQYSDILLLTLILLILSSIIDYIFILEKKIFFNLLFFPIDRASKLFLFIFTGFYWGIDGVIYAFFIYSIGRFIFILVYLKKRDYFSYKYKEPFLLLIKKVLLYAIPFGFGINIQMFAQRLDKYILNMYIEPNQFAIYSIAFFSIPILGEVFSSINNTAMPKFTEYANNNEYEKIISLWHNIVKKTSSITIPIVFYFILMAPELIVFLFTDKYYNAILYYRIYALIFLFGMTSYGLVLRAMNKTKLVFKANLISFIIVVIVSIIIIPKYLTLGAIFTALLAWVLPVVIQLFYESRLLDLSLKTLLPWKTIFHVFSISSLSILVILPIKYYYSSAIFSLSISFFVFVAFNVFFQQRYNLFIYSDFPELITKIKNKFIND